MNITIKQWRKVLYVQDTCDERSSSTTDIEGKVGFNFLLWAVVGCLLPITPRNAHNTSSGERRGDKTQKETQNNERRGTYYFEKNYLRILSKLIVVCLCLCVCPYPVSVRQCYLDIQSVNPDTEWGILIGWGSLWGEWLCAGLSPGAIQA